MRSVNPSPIHASDTPIAAENTTRQDAPRYATSLLKSIDILEALGGDAEVSLAEISRRVGLGKPSVHRVLATLASRGYVERVGKGGAYRLGIRAFELGTRALANRDVRAAARDVMHRLLAETGEVVNLSVPAGDGLVVLDQMIGPSLVQMRARIGDRLPLDRTSSGRAYLTTFDVRQLWQRYPLVAHDVIADRDRGYAIDDCLYQPDLRCAAAPIFDGWGNVSGIIGVSAPAYRVTLTQLTTCIGPAVAQAALEVTARLGGVSTIRPHHSADQVDSEHRPRFGQSERVAPADAHRLHSQPREPQPKRSVPTEIGVSR